ncbi:TcaA NTF2-like domain-containing protein [Lysinibacillus sp. 54212]|uniref:TcaA NTF2-like domain-containing protein n=1 Tax=Lysinibacillus sp. 54212 TaxID=3119829 RepID=UPI002FCA1044
MRTCTVCGAQAKDNQNFCLECGNTLQPLPASKEQQALDHNQQPTPQKNLVKTPMKKSTKILLGVIAGLAVFIGIAHFIIESTLDPSKQLSELNKAFVDENYSAFTSSFTFPKGTIVDEKAFYTYLEENNWQHDIRDELKDRIEKIKSDDFIDPILDSNDNKLITVKEESFLLFYKKVVFQVNPVRVKASTNIDKVTISYGDSFEDVIGTKNKSIGKFAPGNITFKVNLKDDYFEQEIKQKHSIAGNGKNKTEIYFDFEEQLVTLTSDVPEAIVFINGENTKKTAEEISLFAAPLDGSVEIYAESEDANGKKVKSEMLALKAEDSHIKYGAIQEQKQKEEKKKEAVEAAEDFLDSYSEDARDLYYAFRDDYSYAVNQANFDYVQRYFIHNSQLQKDYVEFVVDHQNLGYYSYNFVSNEITDIQPLNEKSLTVDTIEIFEFYSEEDGTWYYERNKRYVVELVNSELRISGITDTADVKKKLID